MADILAVQIKEEPLDEEEVMSGQQLEHIHWPNIKGNDLFKALIKSTKNKEESAAAAAVERISNEPSDVITVDVSCLKGDNELNFMQKLTLSTQTKTCAKCLHIFYTNDEYQRHVVDNKCTQVPKIFPCAKLCGRYFKTAEQCKLHEAKDHRLNEKSSRISVKEKTPPKRYKLKSEFLKKPAPLKLASNQEPIVIKEEPKSPLSDDCEKFVMPLETTMNIKEEELIVPEVQIKMEPEEILPDNWKNTVGLQLPANLKVVSMPVSNVNVNSFKFKPISLPHNSAFKPIPNGMLQIQSLPKNMKIVKIDKPPNIITTTNNTTTTTTTTNTFPVNLIQANNINNNSAMLVKLEKILPSTTKIQQIVIPQQVLKPANLNNQNNNNNYNNNFKSTFPVNGGQYTVTMPFQRSYTSKLESNKNLEDMQEAKAAERVRKIQVESKVKLREIESLPQKRQVIKEMLQQIKMAEELTTPALKCNSSLTDGSQDSQNFVMEQQKIEDTTQNSISICSDTPVKELTKSVTSAPIVVEQATPAVSLDANGHPGLYLPIITTFDQEIAILEKNYPQYRFSWVCPKCPRLYEIKRAARNHLTSRHNVNDEDLQKTQIEYRGFPLENFETKKKSKKATNKKMLSSQEEDSPDDQANSASSIRKRKPHTCPRCNRIFSGSGVLRDHLRANCSRDPQYPCPACSKRFYSASTLNCHLTIHTGELPHKCNFCDKRFRTRGQVTVHHRTHTGERPFVCQVCNQAFTHRETLIAHLSRHIGMKRYKCYGCDKHFSCISGLKTHRDKRPDTCAKVKFNPRAVGPRVRVIRGNVLFEPQPEINPYLRTEDPPEVLAEIQNQPQV